MRFGTKPVCCLILFIVSTTSIPLRDWPTANAWHLRLKLSTIVNTRNRLPSNRASDIKSRLQHWLIVFTCGRITRCAPDLLRRCLLVLRFKPSRQYSLCTRLWLSVQPSRRRSVKIRWQPYLILTCAISFFLLPIVKCSLANAHFSTDFFYLDSCFGLLKRKNDLWFCKFWSFHRQFIGLKLLI